MATKLDPKNLEEALKMLEDLETKLQTAAGLVQQARSESDANKALATGLQERVTALTSEVNTLSASVGLNGGKGLPKEVQEDIKRRIELGLQPAEAVHAALRQQRHNEHLEKKATETAKAAKDAVAKAR